MASELAVVVPRSIEESERLSVTLAKSQLLPDALRGKPSDVLATILAGAELGLAPMQSVRGIVVIKGKPTLSADTMGALVKRRQDVCEYLVVRESSATCATYETRRKGDPSPTTLSFTSEDAARAGLGGDNWRKYPAAMLRARALSAICRSVYPDLCLGLYDPDELAEERPATQAALRTVRDDTVDAEVVERPAVASAAPPAPVTVPRGMDPEQRARVNRVNVLWTKAKVAGTPKEVWTKWLSDTLQGSRAPAEMTEAEVSALEAAFGVLLAPPKRDEEADVPF